MSSVSRWYPDDNPISRPVGAIAMSPRYYLISAIVVAVLTLLISVWKEKRTGKEIFFVLCQVVGVLVVLLGLLAGFAKLLEVLGVAQSGFIL